jgi:hypothetical protein
MPSVAAKETLSGLLYQPLASAVRDGEASAAGGVLSTLNVLPTLVVPPSLSAVQLSGVPAVFDVSVVALQPVVERITDSGSDTDQLTVTFDVYQPALPSVPVMTGVTTGGVGSPGTSGRPGARGATRSSATLPATIRGAARRRTGAAY